MFYIGFFVKKWAIRSFPHFLWSLWVNHSGRSPKMRDVSKLLRSLTKNEREWAIRSGCSPKTSDHERIAQVSHQKCANELVFWANSSFFERIAHSLIFSQTWAVAQKPGERIPSPGWSWSRSHIFFRLQLCLLLQPKRAAPAIQYVHCTTSSKL